jgi:hypothetical protein
LFQRESEKDREGIRGDKDSPHSDDEEAEEDLKLSSSSDEETNEVKYVGPFIESPSNRKQKQGISEKTN